MILEKEYLRDRAVLYARKYALVRNPLYSTFAGIGGNCTNFVSQCVLAGSCTMNFTPIYGWFYLSTNRRSASWTGVDFFYNFMTRDDGGVGPFGNEVSLEDASLGDIIQLSNGSNYYHSLIITAIEPDEVYVCANSNDALDRPLSSYEYVNLRVIHIAGVRYDTRYVIDCFESLYSPPLPPIDPEQPAEPAPEQQTTPQNGEEGTENTVE